uniref:Uncharacterized protein n=1 Tax=viral metagenome TaxID=1070528 RepID=A0A6C0DQY9_9ZZZZ
MSSDHINHIEKLRGDFANIITIKTEISKIKEKIQEEIAHLKGVYQELVKNNTKKIFVFCLDSFFFQYKIFTVELENIDRFRILLNNRMYCEYYKLYNIIVTDINEKRIDVVIDTTATRDFPVYKDLEPFHEYKIDDIKDLHTNIMTLLNEMFSQYLKKTQNIDGYNENHRIGFSISNFINTLQHENNQLRDQIMLYINYVSFFHISQKKQLNRISARINEFYNEVQENININRTFSINDIYSQDRLDLLYSEVEEKDKNMNSDFNHSSQIGLKGVTKEQQANKDQPRSKEPENNEHTPDK